MTAIEDTSAARLEGDAPTAAQTQYFTKPSWRNVVAESVSLIPFGVSNSTGLQSNRDPQINQSSVGEL
jgi:hypothetical protein